MTDVFLVTYVSLLLIFPINAFSLALAGKTKKIEKILIGYLVVFGAFSLFFIWSIIFGDPGPAFFVLIVIMVTLGSSGLVSFLVYAWSSNRRNVRDGDVK